MALRQKQWNARDPKESDRSVYRMRRVVQLRGQERQQEEFFLHTVREEEERS